MPSFTAMQCELLKALPITRDDDDDNSGGGGGGGDYHYFDLHMNAITDLTF
jgi:hypothetical protein